MNRAPERLYVAVVGPGSLPAEDDLEAVAEEVGLRIARAGAVLVCGGTGGVMAAACRGAKSGGGTTVGILPGPDRSGANPHVDVAIPTGMGEGRNVLVARTADVVIAIGGEFGTLSEIALALKLGKPVVGIDTWRLAKSSRAVEAIVEVSSPEEAVATAIGLLRSPG